jgi:hypothetical protein
MKRGLWIGAVAVPLVFLAHAAYLSVVAEDAFISFRYASHLATGYGLVWNVGESPVEGYTNFLWVVMCAAALALGLDVAAFAQVLGVVAGLATLLYVWLWGRRQMGWSTGVSLIPCALLALSGPFATWATSGMETSLFTLFVTASLYHAGRFMGTSRRKHAHVLALVLLGATLTRPEGLIVAAILFAATMLRARWGAVVEGAVLFAVVAAVYTVWRVAYFGDWLPNTYYAKVAGAPLRSVRGVIYTGAFFLYFVVPLLPLALVPGERRQGETPWRDARWLPVIALLVSYTAYIVWVGGDYMAMYRFFVPVLPALYLLAVALFISAWSRRGAPLAVTLLIVAATVTAIHSTPLDRALFPKPPRQHGHYGGVQTERWHAARLTLLGEYFGGLRERGDESLATDAIGAVSFHSRLRVYGFHGLVDRRIARGRAGGEEPGLGLPGHEKGDLLYILSQRPTFIMFSRLLTPEPAGYPSDLGDAVAEDLRAAYEPVSVWLVDDANDGESGHFTYYRLRDD